ncbi:hypothetical protein OIF23_30905 (plasmid) [Streptomyces albidoflavus]|uniref:hypothetical protein n=1 Tax=Streptomyces albidoflavus TaxID=1886 RepID=UPI002F912E0F|nr:hypothetical protein OIF23_30905 [Streptomyces albidoflavus]
MTRAPSDSPTELEARVAVLERAVHTALAQLGATDSSRAGGNGVRLADEALRIALAQRNDVDGASDIGFEVLVGCPADAACEDQARAPACTVTDPLDALTGELMTDPDVHCSAHGSASDHDSSTTTSRGTPACRASTQTRSRSEPALPTDRTRPSGDRAPASPPHRLTSPT